MLDSFLHLDMHPPSLQYLMQLHSVIQEREVEMSFKAPCLHLVETTPSILRKMPWVVLREHTVGVQRKLHVAGMVVAIVTSGLRKCHCCENDSCLH